MERPTEIEPRILRRLYALRTELQGKIAEVNMEIQRLEMGRPPSDLSPVLDIPKDRFWKQSIDFNQGLKEQAEQQSDAKAMHVAPPYKHLVQ